MAEFYRLVGDMTIPEEKREEFNELVIKLLNRCGIRRVKEINILGNTFTVLEKALPGLDGMIYFDYSIFEKKRRGICSYNMNTCELSLGDCGFQEFGLVMMLLMIMQESYSATRCYLTRGNNIKRVKEYALVIEDILGIQLQFPYRIDVWGLYMFSRENPLCNEIKAENVWGGIADDNLREPDLYQMLDVAYISLKINPEREHVTFSKEEIKKSRYADKEKYLYSIYLQLLEREELEKYVKRLLDMPIQERKELAKENTDYGCIAEISLYVTAVTLIRELSYAKKVDFWEMWNQLAVSNMYQDYIKEKEKFSKGDKERLGLNFYEAIMRECEDEFLGVWENRDLTLSDDMRACIETWKEKYDAIDIVEDFDMKKEVLAILSDLSTDWNITFVDEEFIDDFLTSNKNIKYKKGIKLLREMMDQNVSFYPELTRKQAVQWVIKHSRSKFDSIEMIVLMRVLASDKTRKKIFGF